MGGVSSTPPPDAPFTPSLVVERPTPTPSRGRRDRHAPLLTADDVKTDPTDTTVDAPAASPRTTDGASDAPSWAELAPGFTSTWYEDEDEAEHRSVLTEHELRRLRHEALAVLRPWFLRTYGRSLWRRAEAWAELKDAFPIPEPSDWFTQRPGTDHPTRLDWKRFLLWQLILGDDAGPYSPRAYTFSRWGCTFPLLGEPHQSDHPKFYDSVAGSSDAAKENRARIAPDMDYMLQARISQLVDSPDDIPSLVASALAVRKGPLDPKARFCAYFKELNRLCAKSPYSAASARHQLRHLRPGDVVAKDDLSKAFLHMTAASALRSLLGYYHPVSSADVEQWHLAFFNVPMFGAVPAPELLHGFVQPALRVYAALVRSAALSVAPDLGAELLHTADTLDAFADDHIWSGTPLAVACLHLIMLTEGAQLGASSVRTPPPQPRPCSPAFDSSGCWLALADLPALLTASVTIPDQRNRPDSASSRHSEFGSGGVATPVTPPGY